MHSFSKLLIILNLCLIINGQDMDPDLQLCADETIDAAVTADDGRGYVFKGNYYWTFDAETGISEDFAEPINERWIDLPSPINASFAIDEQLSRLSTVFIKDENWYLYKGSERVSTGKTSEWPYFPDGEINAAFTYLNASIIRSKNAIYFIYNTDQFAKYEFQDINKPTFIIADIAHTAGRFWYFLFHNKLPITNRTITTIKTSLPPTAILTNTQYIVIFGVQKYCIYNITETVPLCKVNETTKYFNCPRRARPTTTSTSTTPSTSSSVVSDENSNPVVTESESSQTITETTTQISSESIPIISSDVNNNLDTTTLRQPIEDSTTRGKESAVESSEKSSGGLVWFVLFLGVITVVVCIVGVVLIRKRKKNPSKDKSKSKSEPQKKRTKSNESITIGAVNKTDSKSGLRSKRSKSVESLGIRSDQTRSVEVLEDNESLNTSVKKSGVKPTDKKTQDIVEADQMLDKVKSQDTDDLYMP